MSTIASQSADRLDRIVEVFDRTFAANPQPDTFGLAAFASVIVIGAAVALVVVTIRGRHTNR